uniref:Uncharacterized protein n=1 Tax=Rhizobium rhizogenes TaxID=359 RepID=A0A7S4ZTV9_RHIRH|nr:hypothetical protein pC6.5c_643 [Rhizobium rhizogenes]
MDRSSRGKVRTSSQYRIAKHFSALLAKPSLRHRSRLKAGTSRANPLQ